MEIDSPVDRVALDEQAQHDHVPGPPTVTFSLASPFMSPLVSPAAARMDVASTVDRFQPGMLTLISPDLASSVTSNSMATPSHVDGPTPHLRGYRLGRLANAEAIGSYGVVVSASRLVPGSNVEEQLVAKFFGYSAMPPDMSWILREIDSLRHLRDVNGVAKIKGTFMDTNEGLISSVMPKQHEGIYPIIVMERCDGGDLCSRIISLRANGISFSEAHVSKIFKSFMSALAEVHARNMINCDLKTENLVFKSNSPEDLEVKIIDFGLATHLWDRDIHYDSRARGTLAFQAPESITRVHGQYEYSRASDMWQAGCILYILLTMDYPFGGEDADNSNVKHIQQRILDPEFVNKLRMLTVSDQAKDLLIRMFQYDPTMRISARETLKHSWIVNEAELSRADLGDDHKAKTMVKYTKYSLRGLLNHKMENAGKLLELCESLDAFRPDHRSRSNSMTSSSASPSSPESTPSSRSSSRKRSLDDSYSIGPADTSYTPHVSRKLSRCESSFHTFGRKTPISLHQFQRIRGFIIQEFKKTLDHAQALCPRKAVYVRKLFEFPGLSYSTFRSFLEGDDEFENLAFLCLDEALSVLDSNQNGHLDYFECMLGLGPLVASEPHHSHHHAGMEIEGVSIRRSNSCSDTTAVATMSLDPEIYFEIFNIYQTGIIYPLVIIHGLSYMLSKESNIESILKGYNLSEKGLNKEHFVKFFSVVIENTKTSAARTC
jgi:serine/threonine protein kinase